MATETSDHWAAMKSSPRQTSGAKPMACSAPSTRPHRSARWSRRAPACSAEVTSNSRTSGSTGSLRAVRWVRRRPRPAPVKTTSAPCSWASRATAKASEASVNTPVIKRFLSSRMPTGNLSFSSGNRFGGYRTASVASPDGDRTTWRDRPSWECPGLTPGRHWT